VTRRRNAVHVDQPDRIAVRTPIRHVVRRPVRFRPRSSGPGPTDRWVTAAVLITGLSGSILLVGGVIDFLGGRAIDARLLGALNLTAGTLWLVTAIAFRYRTIWTIGIVLAGGLLAMVYGLYYFWQWVRFERVHDLSFGFSVWMLAMGAVTLVALARTWRSVEVTEHHRRELTAALVGLPVLAVAGAVGGIFQFWYVQAYGPSALPPNLVVESRLTPVGHDAASALLAYRVDVDVQNVGLTRVQVLASWYNVRTLTARAQTGSGDYFSMTIRDMLAQQPYLLESQPHRANRMVTMVEPEIVATGELLSRGWYFEPGERTRLSFLTFLDSTEADVLHVSAGLIMARGARLMLTSDDIGFPCQADPRPVNTSVWVSSEPSLVRDQLLPRVRIAYGWQATEDGVLGWTPCYFLDDVALNPLEGPEQPTPALLETINREYGLTSTYSEAQLSLWPER